VDFGLGGHVSQSREADQACAERRTMSLFGALVRTAVNIVTLPVAVAKDVVTLGGVSTGKIEPYTSEKLKQIKDEAETK
jgi:hypothetical protein